MKDDKIFIQHILESINAIKEFSKDLTKKELGINRLKQNAIVREIEIIGEAAKNISKALKEKYPKIPWKEIIGTRNQMIHHYFGLDIDIIFNIIKQDIPKLEKQILKIKYEI